jgi:hypothetical protein
MPGIVQLAKGDMVVAHQHLCQPRCGGHDIGPAWRLKVDLVTGVGVDRPLHPAVRGAEARHQRHLLVGAKALPQPGQRILCIAEVVKQDVHHVVETLELVRVKPDLPLPRRACKRHDCRNDVQAVVRQRDAAINHGSRVLTSSSAGHLLSFCDEVGRWSLGTWPQTGSDDVGSVPGFAGPVCPRLTEATSAAAAAIPEAGDQAVNLADRAASDYAEGARAKGPLRVAPNDDNV